MGGMNALGGPGVWQGGQGGLQNLGQFGALGYPVRPGPAGEEALAHFGQQIPEHLQQTQLFGGLEGKHPLLAKMLEGGIMGAALTPGPEPGRAEGAGQGISRAMQGVLGARQAERQFQIRQIMAPYELARQTAELQGSAQEQRARAAQIQEMNSRAQYFAAMAKETPAQARAYAAEMGLKGKEDQIQMMAKHYQDTANDYQARTQAMAKWHEYDATSREKIATLHMQAVLGSAKMRVNAQSQLAKLSASASKQYEDAIKNRDSINKEIKDLSNSADYLTAGDNDPIKRKYKDLQNNLIDAEAGVSTLEGVNQTFSNALKNSVVWGLPMDMNNPTNPNNIPGGESRGRSTINPNNPAGLNLPGLPR